jgi:hypothetical protein
VAQLVEGQHDGEYAKCYEGCKVGVSVRHGPKRVEPRGCGDASEHEDSRDGKDAAQGVPENAESYCGTPVDLVVIEKFRIMGLKHGAPVARDTVADYREFRRFVST